jgi:hypothetical protein
MLTGWLIGLFLGLRHALEPDHLAALSTLAEPSPRRGAFLGAAWGLGHSLSLLVVGGGLLAFRARMPERIANSFELGVALMLLALGARALWLAFREAKRSPPSLKRPLLVGVAHGLAGSGALTALTLASMPTLGSGLVYMLLFCIGSISAMAIGSGLLGFPLRRLAESRRAHAITFSVAGTLSLIIGVRVILTLT